MVEIQNLIITEPCFLDLWSATNHTALFSDSPFHSEKYSDGRTRIKHDGEYTLGRSQSLPALLASHPIPFHL